MKLKGKLFTMPAQLQNDKDVKEQC